MKRISILLLLFATNYFATGQIFVRGQICDSLTRQGVPYCAIVAQSINYGTMTDTAGFFTLKLPDSCSYNLQLSISSLGYETKNRKLKNIVDSSITFISPASYQIPAITISSKKLKRISLGAKKSSAISGSFGTLSSEILQVALYIPNETNRKGWLSTISFHIDGERGVSDAAFRLRIFEKTDNSEAPGNDLLTKTVLVNGSKKGGWVIVDVDSLSIIFPKDGLFVGFEWLYNVSYKYYDRVSKDTLVGYGHCANLTPKINEHRTWMRSLAKGDKWRLRDWWYADPKKKRNPTNIMIGVTVKIEK